MMASTTLSHRNLKNSKLGLSGISTRGVMGEFRDTLRNILN